MKNDVLCCIAVLPVELLLVPVHVLSSVPWALRVNESLPVLLLCQSYTVTKSGKK